MKKGFTLVELLTVITIIGILATIVIFNFKLAFARARDAERKSDLKQIQNALRLYYNDQGKYPTNHTTNFTINGCGATATSECTWGSTWSAGTTVYMEKLPKDPGYTYRYTRVNLDSYTLDACLENKNDTSGVATTNTSWCPSGLMFEVRQ